jgi:hypothetical protein
MARVNKRFQIKGRQVMTDVRILRTTATHRSGSSNSILDTVLGIRNS